MPEMSNEEQMMEILKKGSPELYAIKKALNETGVDTTVLLKTLYMVSDIQRLSRWGKASILIQDGKVTRVEQSQGFKIE